MVTRSAAVVVCAFTLAADVALADRDDRHRLRHRDYHRHGPVYDIARVVDVDPVWRRVRIEQPRQRCWTEVHHVEKRRRVDRTGAALAGGIVGAAIGHQVGSGDGRAAATVVGAVAGSAIGYRIASHPDDRDDYRVDAQPVERCELVPGHLHRRHLDGYRVTYVHAGRRYSELLPYDPGRRVRIRIDGRPVIVG